MKIKKTDHSASAYLVFGILLLLTGIYLEFMVHDRYFASDEERPTTVGPITNVEDEKLRYVEADRRRASKGPIAMIVFGVSLIGKGLLLKIPGRKPVAGSSSHEEVDLNQPLIIHDPFLEQLKKSDADDPSIRPSS